jgi:hypothetical protein
MPEPSAEAVYFGIRGIYDGGESPDVIFLFVFNNGQSPMMTHTVNVEFLHYQKFEQAHVKALEVPAEKPVSDPLVSETISPRRTDKHWTR